MAGPSPEPRGARPQLPHGPHRPPSRTARAVTEVLSFNLFHAGLWLLINQGAIVFNLRGIQQQKSGLRGGRAREARGRGLSRARSPGRRAGSHPPPGWGLPGPSAARRGSPRSGPAQRAPASQPARRAVCQTRARLRGSVSEPGGMASGGEPGSGIGAHPDRGGCGRHATRLRKGVIHVVNAGVCFRWRCLCRPHVTRLSFV